LSSINVIASFLTIRLQEDFKGSSSQGRHVTTNWLSSLAAAHGVDVY